jgi:hypothetical protein
VRAATTQLSSGTLRIGNATTTGSIGGNVVNNGTLMFNRTDSIGYADVISGTGNLVQQGTGTLTRLASTPTPARHRSPAARLPCPARAASQTPAVCKSMPRASSTSLASPRRKPASAA